MPKNNKKKGGKDTKDPLKLKVLIIHKNIIVQELGNKAFMNQNYEEAIECFTKAIEVDPNEPVFYTNSNYYAK